MSRRNSNRILFAMIHLLSNFAQRGILTQFHEVIEIVRSISAHDDRLQCYLLLKFHERVLPSNHRNSSIKLLLRCFVFHLISNKVQ